MANTDSYTKFLNTYSGNDLLKRHQLSEYGIWEVHGEDSNPDLGGHHHMPKLGLFEGRLEDVIRYAVGLEGFWAWGGGGSISRYHTPKITKIDANTVKKLHEKKARREALKAELAQLDNELD